MNVKDFMRALDKISPGYFSESDIWSVFTEGERRNIRLTSDKPMKNLEVFRGALRSPCCLKWRISNATASLLNITLTGPELDMEITYFIPRLPENLIPEATRWEIYGLLRDYPPNMPDRLRLSDSVAVLLGIVKIRPKDVEK